MFRIRLFSLLGMVVSCVVPAWATPMEQLPPAEATRWIQYLIPLPKQVELLGQVVLPPDQAGVVADEGSPPLVRQAASELRDCLGTPGSQAPRTFTIHLEVGGPSARVLAELPNADQAYLIQPLDGNAGLRVTGRSPHGVYYASKTLQQLIRARRQPDRVHLPLLRVTDWPDLEDRGLWGGDSAGHIRWMSDRKFNIDEQIATNRVDADGRPQVELGGLKQRMIDEGPTFGVKPLPVILHLEQLSGSGLFQAYPQLQGQGPAGVVHPGAICYSRPEFPAVLAEWLLLWTSKPGVNEVDVWMAENMGGKTGCQCADCAKEDRSVLEARAIVAGYNQARQTRPDLGIRVLTSEATEDSNPRVFAELPAEIKIWYYHSLATYNTSESPMIPPYLADVARERWVGICCNLCAVVQFWQPFTGPQFIRARMNEFVDKKIAGLIGYAVPRLNLVRFNTEAAAEWSWNATGRSARAFALSWAVREGYRNPELFADWTDVHGPVAWDVYGSDFPSGEKRRQPGPTVELLKNGRLPELGVASASVTAKPWGDIKSIDQLQRNVRDAARSVELARQLDMPEFVHESLIIEGYMKAIQALWELRGLVRSGRVADADKDAARIWFKAYAAGLEQARAGLTGWQETMSAPSRQGGGWIDRPMDIIGRMISEMQALARETGCD